MDDDADSDEEDSLEVLDEFISKIATMLTSLLEGEEDIEILQKMNFSLQPSDMKNRMLNVFGMFLKEIGLYPKLPQRALASPKNSKIILKDTQHDLKLIPKISQGHPTMPKSAPK